MPRSEGENRAGDAILAAGKSSQAGLCGAERKQADADDRFRIPPLLTALPQCRRESHYPLQKEQAVTRWLILFAGPFAPSPRPLPMI